MNGVELRLAGATLVARGTGALFWPARRVLAVADLHLGKAARLAARGGALLPPYEAQETLNRLEAEIHATGAAVVICLGDSFDSPDPALPEAQMRRVAALAEAFHFTWIAGNHDPFPPGLPGLAAESFDLGALSFRHIARPGAQSEISGHYHPKARLDLGGRRISRPCFLADEARVILPAFGAYTGGLDCTDPALTGLMQPGARAVLTGPTPRDLPLAQLALAPAPRRPRAARQASNG